MLPEKRVETQIKRYLDNLGAYWIKTLGGSVPAGTPDILACVNGYFVAIEVKKPSGGVVSELQKFQIKKIQNAGGVAFVAKSIDEVKSELSRFNVI
ncbi:VRR-NUC domain-containing protein [Aerococcus sp. 1KP-2016]|uniref:VRR-NUC domain-containing protein n=1 Tax=Aerococcus sp. 1KP-2016 TaxID=1981982 RepID=UPI000BD763AE|nr:recombinase RecB [Aerococcus sp. 1KP-2016]